MDSKTRLRDENDGETFEIKEEKLDSSMTLDKMELTESDKSCRLLQDNKDTECLESIQNYAQRIKSFLGWESEFEEQDLENARERKTEISDRNSNKNFLNSVENSECSKNEKELSKAKLDLSSAVLNFEEVIQNDCENTISCMENDGNLNNIENNTNSFNQNCEDELIESKHDEKSENFLNPEKDITERNFENSNVILNPSSRESNLLQNNNLNSDLSEFSKDIIDSSKIDNLNAQSSLINTNNYYITDEDLKISDSLGDGGNSFNVNTMNDDTSDSVLDEINKQFENQVHDENASLSDSNKKVEINERILKEPALNNLEPEIEGTDYHSVINKKANSKTGSKDVTSPKEGINLISISDSKKEVKRRNSADCNSNCISESKNDSEKMNLIEINTLSISEPKINVEGMSTEKVVSLCISDPEIERGRSNSDSTFESKINSFTDADFSKEKIISENSEIIFSEDVVSLPDRDSSSEKGLAENDNFPSRKSGISESFKDDDAIIQNKNIDTEDLRSEDSLDLDENLPNGNNLPKQYVKEIRRLSRGIVKDVIESARNSVHELYASKNENLDITSSLSETLKNICHGKNGSELYFNNNKQQTNDNSELDRFSNEKFDNNLDYKDVQIQPEQDIPDGDTICGCGFFKPRWIQKYATPRAYLILFSIIGVIHGCYYPYVVSILSTLEKRYAFKTKISGILLLADEITPLILGILVGYIGGKTHRPRMVALGMCLTVVCCFLSGLPYLIYGTSKHISYSDEYKVGPKLCENGLNSTHCDSDEQPPTLSVIAIFLIASFLKGFATLSFYVIGFSYMDDIIKRKNSPLYFAIIFALRLLGPLVAFLMSSGLLNYYENPLYDPGFGPNDPRWIGAWWIGFFLIGIILLVFTIPIALFPRRLPSQKKSEKVVTVTSEDGLKKVFGDLLSALKRLGKNPVYIVLIINTIMKIFGHFGHHIMLPKYMENQFRISASEASLLSGALTIVCIIISTMLGGFLIWKFTPRIKVLLGGMIVSEVILCVGFLVLMIPRCQTFEMLHFGMNEDGLILNNVCNKICDCSTSSFTPFCGPDGKTIYFSPCYAGCTEDMTSSTSPKVNKEFGNCSCVEDQEQMGATISEGFCSDPSCRSQMITYLIILFILVTVSSFFSIAPTMILLRSVHPSDKSIALGTFETFTCLFGFIPFPVTFGALVDSACLVWEKSCGETGNCWFYDMDKYTYLLHGTSAFFCSLCVVCLITLYFLSPRVQDLYIEEDEEETDKYVDIKLDTVSGSVTKL